MLQKFLFIGVGGSGGKTLRILRDVLENRLQEAGYSGPFPRAWQLRHIDVPDVPDGNEPSLPPQLPTGSYTGLAPRGLNYVDLDDMVVKQGAKVMDELVGWRPGPAPKTVNVAPTYGAGQYRVVGRMVGLASMQRINRSIETALGALRDISVDEELDRVGEALGVRFTPARPEPMAIVVTSLAGGAGSGIFLDVCDVLRLLEPDEHWTGHSIGILYTPDVFLDLPPAARGGVHGNGLAAISEVLAGYWNASETDPEQYALLAASGIAPSPTDRSGPRFPFLVGSQNDEIRFSSQNDAYRAVARSLAAMVTSAQVQDAVRAYLFGNYAMANATLPDSLGLATSQEKPFTSLGYGSVSLGRDRFARYSASRLGRHAIDRLLRGHWNERVPEEQTPEAACDQLARDNLYVFGEECGLRELGPEHNQILDAVRGGTAVEARRSSLKSARDTLVKDVTTGGASFKATEISRRLLARLEELRPKVLADFEADDQARALDWVRDIQIRVVNTVAIYLGRVGAPTTARMLDLMIDELERAVVPELRRDAETTRNQFGGTIKERVSGALQSFEGESMLPDNPLIGKAGKGATDTLWAESEANIQERAARLVEDLTSGFLRPLRAAIDRGRERLDTQTATTTGPSAIANWSTDTVPLALTPAQNEILLEPVTEYPSIFEAKVQATVGAKDPGSAVLTAVREIVLGADRVEDQAVVRCTTTWVPRTETLRMNDSARSATFEVRIEVDDLLHRATEWQRRPDTAFSMHVEMPLVDYLDPSKAEPAEHADRLARFRGGFQQVLQVSLPLTAVNSAMLQRIHQRPAPQYHRVMTSIPFPPNHPAREIVKELLLHDGMDPQHIDKNFDDGKQSRIEVSTFLATPYEPVVFDSLMQPIAAERAQIVASGDGSGFWRWRRTRRLAQFIPTSADVRLDMMRGWFVGRILGLLDVDEPRKRAVTVRLEDGATGLFPFPLLGPPVDRLIDLLPAVLESLPVALVEMTKRGDDSIKPYWRIRDLGRAANFSDPDYDELPEILASWVLSGNAPTGVTPPPDFAGKADQSWQERLAAVEAFIERFAVGYRELDTEGINLANISRLGRAWELRTDLLRVLQQLKGMCDRTRTRASGDGEVG